MSWADEERDVTAWLGNELQNEAFTKLYGLFGLAGFVHLDLEIRQYVHVVDEGFVGRSVGVEIGVHVKIKALKNKDFDYVWNFLQTSDHFYYMATKWLSDGDVAYSRSGGMRSGAEPYAFGLAGFVHLDLEIRQYVHVVDEGF